MTSTPVPLYGATPDQSCTYTTPIQTTSTIPQIYSCRDISSLPSPVVASSRTPNPPTSQSVYARASSLGYQINENVRNPVDPSNPLTYSILPTYNTNFLHGAGIATMNNRTWSRNVQNFMAEYCAGGNELSNKDCPWDGFCEAYKLVNTDTVWGNSAVIDTQAYTYTMKFLGYTPTQGEQLVHNSAERRFLNFYTTTSYQEPFDYTVANSPMVRYYSHLSSPGTCVIQNLDDPVKVENDSVVQQMLQHAVPCADVLTRIYLAYRSQDPRLSIQGTSLEKYLVTHADTLEKIADMLIKNLRGYNSMMFAWSNIPSQGGIPRQC